MRLYYAPAACSLAPHIIAREAGISLDLVKVDPATKTTEAGEDSLGINPKGSVPDTGPTMMARFSPRRL